MRALRRRVPWAGSAFVVLLGTFAFLAVAPWVPGQRPLASRGYVTFVAAVVIARLVRVVLSMASPAGPRPFDLALRPQPVRPRIGPRDLEALEQLMGAATNRAMELHYLLRPRLREIAADRLRAHHGLLLGEEGDEATRHLLGDEAWRLLRPDRPEPADRFGPGIPLSELERIVAVLEQL